MDQQKQLISLKLPALKTKDLSFCKPTVRDLKQWLHSLPKANTGEYSRQLYVALTELNQLQIAEDVRLQLLELLRPEVALITKQLDNTHLLKSVILDQRSTKIAKLCQAMQQHLSIGYKHIVNALQHKRSAHLATAIQRAIQSLYTVLARAYLVYSPVPPGIWFELHQLYGLAYTHQIHNAKVKDPLLNSLTEQSLVEAYSCALLLGCAHANQLRQRDILQLVEKLPQWSQLTSLQSIDEPSSLFVVALTSDTPPRYKSLLNLQGHHSLIGFNTSSLVSSLKAITASSTSEPQAKQPATLVNQQRNLLEHLEQAWGDIAQREFDRTPTQGTIEMCIGMSAVHFHLSGEQLFEETLKDHTQEATSKLSLQEESKTTSSDVWAMAIDAPEDIESLPSYEPLDYKSMADESDDVELERQHALELYKIVEAHIVNQSPGGYCVEWREDAPAQLQTGDILALRAANSSSWFIGNIRWIRQSLDKGTQIGIELLAPQVVPCGLQLIRGGREVSSYLRALQIPEIKAISRPACLITPKVPFREGSTVRVNESGYERKALLKQLMWQTDGFSQYKYTLFNEPTLNKPINPHSIQPPPTLSISKAQPAKDHSDDFSSLWNTL